MKPDDFELLLQRQTPKPLPPGWRAEILQAVRQAAAQSSRPVSAWSVWLWPGPQAWAGLAAVWVAILALNLASGWKPFHGTADKSPDQVELSWLAFQQQQRRLTQLLNQPASTPVAEPPKPLQRTRSSIGKPSTIVG